MPSIENGQNPDEHEGYLGHSLDSIATTPSLGFFQRQGYRSWGYPLGLLVYGLMLGILDEYSLSFVSGLHRVRF